MSHDWSVLDRDLRRCLPPRAIVAKRQELLSYDCDGLTLERHCPPLAVLPETTEQVAARDLLGGMHGASAPPEQACAARGLFDAWRGVVGAGRDCGT